jgi:hypothetical protein
MNSGAHEKVLCTNLMKKLLTFIFLLLPLSYAAAQSREARLTNVSGKVYLRAKGLDSNQWVEAEKDTPLEEGDTIRTGENSSAEVTVDGDSVVLLNSNTAMETNMLQSAITRFSLAWGSLTAKIRKIRESNERVYFKTPVAVAAVRGTELAVSYDENNQEEGAVVGVFDEGQVAVESEGHDDVIINQNEETEVKKDAAPTAPRPLEKLLVNRPNIVHVRERIVFLKPNWQPVAPLKRIEYREHLLHKPRLRYERPRPTFKAPAKFERRERMNRPLPPGRRGKR